MSYEVVRTVKVVGDQVLVTSASNNVYPRTPHQWEMKYRNDKNPFTGRDAALVEVLAGYEQGSFQGGSNRFTRALETLRHMPEYKAYDWRGEPYDEIKARRDGTAYYHLLKKALDTPAERPRYVISKISAYGETVYFKQRKGASFGRWVRDITKANKYAYADDAEAVKGYFPGSSEWRVIDMQEGAVHAEHIR